MSDRFDDGDAVDGFNEDEEARRLHRDRLLERRERRERWREEFEEEEAERLKQFRETDDGRDRESILEKMRDGGGLNPVQEKELEEMRAEEAVRTRAKRSLGLVVLALTLIAVGFVLFPSDDYTLTADFENASQLVGGEPIKIGGTSVGKAESPELGPNGHALVKFTVDDQFAPLPANTVATVRSFSLSGVANRHIQLTLPPEGEGSGEIPDGGFLDTSQTVSEVDLDQIFNTLDDETVRDFKKVIKGFAVSYGGGDDPDTSIPGKANRGTKFFNPFLSTSRRVFGELNKDEGTLERLIVDTADLSGALASRSDDVSGLISNVDTAMGALADERTNLATSIRELPDFMRNFNTTSVNLRSALDDVAPLVDASTPVAKKLQPFFAEFRAAARNLVPTVKDLDQIVKDPGANNDLVDLTNLQVPLTKIASGPVKRNGEVRRGAFPETVASLRDGLEPLAYLRPYSSELVGWFDDFSGHSGGYDANGGYSRIGTTLNAFTASPAGIPQLTPAGLLTATELYEGISLGNFERCPGGNERPAPDGSNPFTDGGALDCDPTQYPPGD